MERICPFLALESDSRTVVAGYDPEHRCGASLPREPLDRIQQVATCLEPEHTRCPRYVAAMQLRAETMPFAPASPDADLLSTRLVLGPESARRVLVSAAAGARTRRWAVGAALAVTGIVAVAGGVLGALGSIGDPGVETGAAGSASASVPVEASAVPATGGRPTASVPPPTAAATPQPTETPRGTRTAPPSAPADEGPRTYVVQEGDTLAGIANAFGTSVSALQAANDLEDTDVILIGQELLIP